MQDIQKERINQALQNLKIESLNEMQQAALQADASKNLILLSPTGSGKTIAFLLPLLCSFTEQKTIQGLILVPSRELALQIEQVFKSMQTGFKIVSCYGGHPIADEKRSIMGTHPALIVGTPGRVLDHLTKGNFDSSTIHTLAIDEFDKSLEFGFQDQMEEILTHLTNLQKRILLSATDAEEIPRFVGTEAGIKLNYLTEDEKTVDKLTLYTVHSPERDKLETLFKLLCHFGSDSTLVFCNHREAVDRVSDFLQEAGLPNEAFHGGMEQPDRERALYKFRNGSCHVFVSTDLASRGLDISAIQHIVHYHLPINQDAYIHRNGRTARWESTGNAYIVLTTEETLPPYIDQLPETFTLNPHTPKPSKPLWATLYIGKGKKDKLNKIDIVGFLSKVGKLAQDEIGTIDVKDHFAFVAIKRNQLKPLLKSIKGEKIKGIKTKIEEAD